MKLTAKVKKLNRSSDVIILDESFEKLRADFPKPVGTNYFLFNSVT